MDIEKNAEGGKLTLIVAGRLDTTTAPQLQQEISAVGNDVKKLEIDFSKLEYISSAGLRVLLMAQKAAAARGGEMAVLGANANVREVFDITGLSGVLTLV